MNHITEYYSSKQTAETLGALGKTSSNIIICASKEPSNEAAKAFARRQAANPSVNLRDSNDRWANRIFAQDGYPLKTTYSKSSLPESHPNQGQAKQAANIRFFGHNTKTNQVETSDKENDLQITPSNNNH